MENGKYLHALYLGRTKTHKTVHHIGQQVSSIQILKYWLKFWVFIKIPSILSENS